MRSRKSLGYIVKAYPYTNKAAQRDRVGVHTTPCLALLRPNMGVTSPLNAHLHMPEGHRGPTAGRNPNQGSPRNEGTASPGPSQDSPRMASAPVSRLEAHLKVLLGAALQISFGLWGSLPGAAGHTMGCWRRPVWNCTVSYYKMFRGGSKGGKRQEFRWLGVLCVCVPTGNMFSALLLVWPGAWSCGSLFSLELSDPTWYIFLWQKPAKSLWQWCDIEE